MAPRGGAEGLRGTGLMAKRLVVGVVTSDGMRRTRRVEVPRLVRHPKYGKYLRRRKRYLAHDEKGTAQLGDSVEIASTRPLSKRKRWRLERVISRSQLGGLGHGDATAEIMADLTGKTAQTEAGR